MFFHSVYKLVSIPLQGTWSNEDLNFKFDIEPKPINEQSPGHIVNLVLFINNDRKGIVELKFQEDGVCHIWVDSSKMYKIHAMYYNADGEFCLTLVKSNNSSILLKKQEIL